MNTIIFTLIATIFADLPSVMSCEGLGDEYMKQNNINTSRASVLKQYYFTLDHTFTLMQFG